MAETPEQSSQPQWRLVLHDDSAPGQSFPITGEIFTIGRELFNDLPLEDLHVSKQHARLIRQEDHLLIEDLDSVNGTLVNDSLIAAPYALQPGDTITLGPFTFSVEQVGVELTQAQTPTRVYPVTAAPIQPGRLVFLLGAVAALLIVVALLGFGLYWLLVAGRQPRLAELPASPVQTETAVAARAPAIVINQAPASYGQVQVNRSIVVQATASDPTGINRMELWVNDQKVDQVASQLTQNVPSMTAAFQWAATTPGTYLIIIRAYNQAGLSSSVTVTNLTAIGSQNTATPLPIATPAPTFTPPPPPPTFTPAPLPTPTPAPPTPTPRLALLSVNAPVLNVRQGPGLQYSSVGQLKQGDGVVIVSQASTPQGRWWQIRFDQVATGLGWVSADPGLVTTINTDVVPGVSIVAAPPAGPTEAVPSTPTPTPTPTQTLTPPPPRPVILAPAGKTLLIVSNRSLDNKPARLTLSGGKSVGGGQEIDVAPGNEAQIVLEPDFYRALWSSPVRNFRRGADFTAVAGKVMVMWVVPEDGLAETEIYDELTIQDEAVPTSTPSPTPAPVITGYTAPPGKALLVVANKSLVNQFGVVTVSGGSFGGGQQITLDANTEIPLELLPGNYRTIWSTPGFSAGKEFRASSGEVILGWIVPETKQVFMQFPGQPAQQINN